MPRRGWLPDGDGPACKTYGVLFSRADTMGWIGIAPVAIAVVALFVSLNSRRFGRNVASEAAAMWGGRRQRLPVDEAHQEKLPTPVRRYVEKALAHRVAAIQTARLLHGGAFRTKLNGRWRPIRGKEYFTADPPCFVWWGRAQIVPGVWVDARDQSVDGVGGMLIAAESTFILADSKGPGMDQGALLRLLAETPWFPTALLDERYVTWASMDDRRAGAMLRLNGREVHGVFEFGEDDLPSAFTAERHRDLGNGTTIPTPWVGRYADYREVEGMLVPHDVVVSWRVDGQESPYARFSVERLEFDVDAPL